MAGRAYFCGRRPEMVSIMLQKDKLHPNNRLQGTGTLKVGQAPKVLFRSAVLRKRSPVPEPGVSAHKEILAAQRQRRFNG